jgi:hypothetical protein
VRPAPDGNYRKEAEFLLSKANQYPVWLSTLCLSEMDTFIFHQSTYIPSMAYSLPVTMIDINILNKIQWQAIQAILNKLGVSKSFPHWVAFGPKDLCGMALMDKSVEQGIWGVQHFTDHLFSRDLVGNLILIALRSLQLESGCGFHLLESPSEWVPYITECWLTLIQDFISRQNITIKVASSRLMWMSRAHDCHVMDTIWQLEIYNDKQLFDINAAQMYLQVMTLSDIADANGHRISEEAFKRQKLSDRYSRLKWTTSHYAEAKKLVESSSRSCIYFFWHGFEATIRGVDRTPNSSLEELLQPGNQPSRHVNAWIYDSIYGIQSVSTNLAPCGCHSVHYCFNICVSWRRQLEHYDSSKCDEDSD